MDPVAMIGFFTMMPIILTGLVKLVRDYSRPPGEVEEMPAEEEPAEELPRRDSRTGASD